jgi:hypothetical protein
MEQQLPACLGEREIAEFVEDGEVEAGQLVGDESLAAGSTFGLKRIDEAGAPAPRLLCPASMTRPMRNPFNEAALDQIDSSGSSGQA